MEELVAARRPCAVPALKPKILTLRSSSEAPATKLTPTRPVPAPLMDRLRRITLIVFGVAVAESLTLMPLVPAARIEPNVPSQSMVIDLVIVTAPNPPGSRQSISPLAAVLEIAPATVLHGALALHGFASSPTPEPQVRVDWARAGFELSMGRHNRLMAASSSEVLMMFPPVCSPRWDSFGRS